VTLLHSHVLVFPVLAICFALVGCEHASQPKESTMSASGSPDAKAIWDSMNAEIEASQDVLGTEWLSSDTAARACGADGAQWVITRFGPGTRPEERAAPLGALATRWTAKGWSPVTTEFGGDTPGVQLRYPAGSTLDDGFFIEFRSTVRRSTLQLQTPCTTGNVDALNREQYGEKHTSTPPFLPGATPPDTGGSPSS